ncbi:MAG: hypothetical protein JWR26_1177 [Pedosphaera sp.]|nr:hypothetical protein [Pedosphaera sp.]
MRPNAETDCQPTLEKNKQSCNRRALDSNRVQGDFFVASRLCAIQTASE